MVGAASSAELPAAFRRPRRRLDQRMVPRPLSGYPGLVVVDATWGRVQPMQLAPGVRTVGELEVIAHLEAGLPLVDSRRVGFFRTGTIPGAVSLPHHEVEVRSGEVDRGTTAILFCNGPQCAATPDAVDRLLRLGHPAERLGYYRGGMHDWVTLGFEVASGDVRRSRRNAGAAPGTDGPMNDPRQEAAARVGGRYAARVLEPSPPAVEVGPWFADDPVARGEDAEGLPVLSPVGTGEKRWSDLAAGDEELAAWCRERWLGPWPRLEPPAAGLVATREALHRLAERVMSPARAATNGKIALRWTRGGFGTPFFGADEQLRVFGTELVRVAGGAETRAPITTLAAAAELAGRPLDGEDAGLAVDAGASGFLGAWFGFGASVLEELRADAGPELEPSRVQLWAEHFDLSVELGAEAAGRRAGYGASPGDELHPEPYLYVVPWEAPDEGPLWNASGFAGGELPYAALLEASDQRALALQFYRERLAALTG